MNKQQGFGEMLLRGEVFDLPPNAIRVVNADNYSHRAVCQIGYGQLPRFLINVFPRCPIWRRLISWIAESDDATIRCRLKEQQLVQVRLAPPKLQEPADEATALRPRNWREDTSLTSVSAVSTKPVGGLK
jgi:hypothetical protein